MNIPDDIYGREVVAARWFEASPTALWALWADPALIARWWGPNGFTNSIRQHEFRAGGRWELTMHGPDGTNYPNELIYRVIEPERRIVIEHLDAPNFLLTAEFESFGGRTKLTFRQLFDTAETCAMVRAICVPANEDNLDRMEAVLAGS